MRPIKTIKRIKKIIISATIISVFAGGIHIQKPAIQNYTANKVYNVMYNEFLNSKNVNSKNKYISDAIKKVNKKDKQKIINIISKYINLKNASNIIKYINSGINYNEMLKILNSNDRKNIEKILQKYLK